jgi:hypothetical protein
MSRPFNRRQFLSRTALAGIAAGWAHPLGALALRPRSTVGGHAPFRPAPDDTDASVFAAARKHFLFPESVTYCNTGTLGGSPREVVDALTHGLSQLEHDLPDWPYFQADGEPLTGYQPLVEARTSVGAFIGAPAEEIAFTLNATMGMSFLAKASTWSPETKFSAPIRNTRAASGAGAFAPSATASL